MAVNFKYGNDLTGMTFGKLYVVRQANPDEGTEAIRRKNDPVYLCRCTCGREKIIRRNHLVSGQITSCGCTRQRKRPGGIACEQDTEKAIKNIWYSMRNRCRNPNHKNYNCYGGKGIKIAPEWDNYENFRYWMLKNKFQPGLSLDRIDPDKDYCPENCRLRTMISQQANKSNNIQFESKTYNDESFRQACLAKGINYSTARMRIARGDTPDQALSTEKKSNKFYYRGKTLYEWCTLFGFDANLVKVRMSRNKENFRDAMLYYALKRGDKALINYVQNLPTERDNDRAYYTKRKENPLPPGPKKILGTERDPNRYLPRYGLILDNRGLSRCEHLKLARKVYVRLNYLAYLDNAVDDGVEDTLTFSEYQSIFSDA